MKVQFDTNPLLDVFLERADAFAASSKLWQAVISGRIVGYLSASSVRDIHYFVSKEKGAAEALKVVIICLSSFNILPLNHRILTQAAGMIGADFEDNIQIACALVAGVDAIVTSNIKDFRNAGITLYTPEQLVKKLRLR